MEKEATIKYSNEEITVLWKPNACIHSKLCWQQLGEVFKPKERPWVKMDGANTEKIIAQINKCPSGALSYQSNNNTDKTSNSQAETTIQILPNGPLLVHGNILIKRDGGKEIKKDNVTAFCRCGQSSNKPYCDGAHSKVNFSG